MQNINGVRDCKELLEFSQQRKISQIEKFHTKILSIWKHMCMRVHFLQWSKSNLKTNQWKTKDRLGDSLRVAPLTLVLMEEQ